MSVPRSLLIRSPSFIACSFVAGCRASIIVVAKLEAVSNLEWIGQGPAPAVATISPQKGWSPKNGSITVGLPAAIPADVVPAPP